jgi:hypothetical protein
VIFSDTADVCPQFLSILGALSEIYLGAGIRSRQYLVRYITGNIHWN